MAATFNLRKGCTYMWFDDTTDTEYTEYLTLHLPTGWVDDTDTLST